MTYKSNMGLRDETAGERVNSYRTMLVIAVWDFVQVTLFRYSPRRFYFFRRWLLRLFGAKVASKVYIYPCVRIEYPWKLIMEDYTSIGREAWIYNLETVEIRKFATISQRAHLCGGTHDYRLKNFPLIRKPIIICENSWIAADVFISPGVTIGRNAVIGARSVVTKDMPADMICVGNPCKPIKKRLENIDVANI